MDRLKSRAHSEDELKRLTLKWLETPADEHTLFQLGLAHQVNSNLPQCIRCYEMAIDLSPSMTQALSNQATALKDLGYFDWALQRINASNPLQSGDAQLINNLGAILLCLGRHLEAIDCYSKALAISAFDEQTMINLAFAKSELMLMDEAVAIYQEVLRRKPDCFQAQFNLSLIELLKGNDELGWRLYEARLFLAKNAASYSWRTSAVPIWSGSEPVQGRVVWVHAEQGLGDTLQFCREALTLIEWGAKVVMSVPKALVTTVSTLSQALTDSEQRSRLSVLNETEGLVEADFQIAMMSLPLALMRQRGGQAFMPRMNPYLFANESKVSKFALALGTKKAMRVGLVWSGGHRAELPSSWALNARRNIALSHWGQLKNMQLELFSLQKGDFAQSDLGDFNSSSQSVCITDLSHWISDFSDTAALVTLMDLVITVDTSVAHLVGALGKPVWIVNRFDVCWRWGRSGSSTRWYESARLFRQNAPGDWASVVDEVVQALDTLTSHEAGTLLT